MIRIFLHSHTASYFGFRLSFFLLPSSIPLQDNLFLLYHRWEKHSGKSNKECAEIGYNRFYCDRVYSTVQSQTDYSCENETAIKYLFGIFKYALLGFSTTKTRFAWVTMYLYKYLTSCRCFDYYILYCFTSKMS